MKNAILAVTLIFAGISATYPSIILVDNGINNGGFETGSELPWIDVPNNSTPSVSGSLSVIGSNSAYQGQYYGQFNTFGPSAGGPMFAQVNMPLSLLEANGNVLDVTFYAKMDSASIYGLDTLNVFLLDSSLTEYYGRILSQGPADGMWHSFTYSFTLSEAFDYSGVSNMVFEMGKVSYVSGRKYSGSIDSVSITQSVPEPSSILLVVMAGVFLCRNILVRK